MRKQEQVTLDGFVYKVTQLPLRESRALLIKLTNLLGPALGEAVTGTTDGFTVDGNAIGGAIKTLAMSLSDEDFGFAQDALFKHVLWTNDTGHDIPLIPITEDHFGGDGMGRLFKLMAAALKVNYADFLADLGFAGLLQENPLPVSRQSSIGSSGVS